MFDDDWWYLQRAGGQVSNWSLHSGTCCDLPRMLIHDTFKSLKWFPTGLRVTTFNIYYCWNDAFFTVTNTADHSNIPSDLGIETIYQLSTVWNHLVVGMASPPTPYRCSPQHGVCHVLCRALASKGAVFFWAERGRPFPRKKSKSPSGRWRNLRDVQWCRYCPCSYWKCAWLMLVNGTGCSHVAQIWSGEWSDYPDL